MKQSALWRDSFAANERQQEHQQIVRDLNPRLKVVRVLTEVEPSFGEQ